MSKETFEHILSNPAPVSDSGALSAAQFTSADAGLWRNLGRPAAVSDNTASTPTFADAANWPRIQPVLAGASSVDFVGADHDPKVVPDFILGADGKLRPNPAKTEPSPDGKVTIEVEGSKQSEIAAAKLSNENQKAAAREMISYIQKSNPKAGIPQYLLDILNKQPDLPSGASDAPRQQPQRQADSAPSQPAPSYDGGGGGGGGGGGYRGGGGGGGGGYRGGGEGSFDPGARPTYSGDRPSNPPPIAGDMQMAGPPSITPEKIDQVLASYHSPAAEPGMGKFIYDLGVKYGIDPAVAVAFFVQESTAGTAGVAARTHSWGNIVGEGPAGQDGRFRAYHNFREGAEDWFRLIHDKYLASPSQGGFGCQTLSQVISHYAPSSDGNNERAYVANVKGMVTAWAKEDTRKSNTATA